MQLRGPSLSSDSTTRFLCEHAWAELFSLRFGSSVRAKPVRHERCRRDEKACPKQEHAKQGFRHTQIELRGLGEVINAPADVQLSAWDIVQPDLIVVLSREQGGADTDED